MLLFGLEPLIKVEMKVPGENIPLMKKLLESIKLAHDAEDPEFDERIYSTCEITLELLKEICRTGGEQWIKEWEKSFPGPILLPKALYRVDQHPSKTSGSHLPKEFRTIPIEFFKKVKKRGRVVEDVGSVQEEAQSTPGLSLSTQQSIGKRQKTRKQVTTPNTAKTRTRQAKRQRQERKPKRK